MARQSGRQMGIRLVLLALVLAAVLIAPSRSPVSAQNVIDTIVTNWIFGPVLVTNRQAVSLQFANTFSGPVTVSMEIFGSRINGATWNAATLLAAQKATSVDKNYVVAVDWNAAGGLGNGERAQVFARLHITGAVDPKTGPVASLVVTDLFGLVPPQLADPRPDPFPHQPQPAIITQDSHFNPTVISNRLAVVMSFANTSPAPVRVSMQILGGRGPGPVINTAVLASRTDLLVGPGEGMLLRLPTGGLADGERAQIFGRLRVTGNVDRMGIPLASLQVTDLLGILPAQTIGVAIDEGIR